MKTVIKIPKKYVNNGFYMLNRDGDIYISNEPFNQTKTPNKNTSGVEDANK